MSYPEVSEYNREEETVLAQTNMSYGKLFLLGVFAIALGSFGPMSLFASVPLTMAILLFGRGKTLFMAATLVTGLFITTVQFNFTPYLGVVFLVAYGYASLIGEIILRKVNPVRGMLIAGAIVMAIAFGLVAMTLVSGVDITQEVKLMVTQTMEVIRENNADLLAQKGEEARMLEDVLSNPDSVVKRIVNWSPAAIFVSNYFIIWACLFVLLRNSIIWRIKHSYPFSVKDLVNFKVPDSLVWPFIFSLALAVSGVYFLGETAEILGMNLLYCFGVFYFFQGFGIYLDFLSFAKIQGIFRSLLVIFTVTMAWKLIAVVGIFDFWINFRRFFEQKEDKNIN